MARYGRNASLDYLKYKVNTTGQVASPPDDSVSAVKFSPKSVAQSSLIVAGSWDNNVRCWELQQNGVTVPKAQQTHTGPVLDADWSDDGTKIFSASCDKTVQMWDLNSNQFVQIAQHDAPVKTVHWIKTPTYTCVMTGSWDKTLKFWDTRQANPIMNITLQERVYCADVKYPMAVVGLAGKKTIVYHLDNQPREVKQMESPLKMQTRCLKIFKDNTSKQPIGYALGSIEGKTSVQYLNPNKISASFPFKCHRTNRTALTADAYAVNAMAFHPVHGSLLTCGSDNCICSWDIFGKTRLLSPEKYDLPVTACDFNPEGTLLALAIGYDWSKPVQVIQEFASRDKAVGSEV